MLQPDPLHYRPMSESSLVREPKHERQASSSVDLATASGGVVSALDLRIVFQPIVHFETLAVFAQEALVRCGIPAFAKPPDLFLAAVQGGWCGVLGRTLREMTVPLLSKLPLFLNVHPSELSDPWLVQPDDPLYFHDHDMYVEITEAVPFDHFELCRHVVEDIRSRANVHIVVDDLGAGYSNLHRVAEMRPSVVKLDRSLVAGIARDSRQQILVRGLVRLCEDLGASVVAEGIETAEEYRALLDTGVHYGQGYLFARPAFPPPGVELEGTLPDDLRPTSPPPRP